MKKKAFELLLLLIFIVVVVTALYWIGYLKNHYELCEINFFGSIMIMIFWYLDGYFVYKIEVKEGQKPKIHYLKLHWFTLLFLLMLLCVPLGWALRILLFSKLRNPNGTLSKKFYKYFAKPVNEFSI